MVMSKESFLAQNHGFISLHCSFFFLLPFLVTSLDSTFIDTNTTQCSYMVWGAFNPANGTVLSSTTEEAAPFGNGKSAAAVFLCTSRVDCAGGIPPPPVTVVVFDGSGLNLDNICLVGGFNVPVTVSASVQNVQNVPLTNFNACPMKLSVIWNRLTMLERLRSR
ncbi:hypothetical protein ACSQ67_009691 [Phaseolus vulgaris]